MGVLFSASKMVRPDKRGLGGCWDCNHSVWFVCVCRNRGVTWSLAPSSRKMPAWCVEVRTPPAFTTTVCTGVTARRSVSTDLYTCDIHINLAYFLKMYVSKYVLKDKTYLLLYGGCFSKRTPLWNQPFVQLLFSQSMMEPTLNVQSLGSFPGNSYPKWFP